MSFYSEGESKLIQKKISRGRILYILSLCLCLASWLICFFLASRRNASWLRPLGWAALSLCFFAFLFFLYLVTYYKKVRKHYLDVLSGEESFSEGEVVSVGEEMTLRNGIKAIPIVFSLGEEGTREAYLHAGIVFPFEVGKKYKIATSGDFIKGAEAR